MKRSRADSDEEASKDDESRCSESDPEDKSYRINVGLYGTDFDEDSTRDEAEGYTAAVHRNIDPDLNNNQQHSTKKQPLRLAPTTTRCEEDRSNTVDGPTRRALESQCLINESSHSIGEHGKINSPNVYEEYKNKHVNVEGAVSNADNDPKVNSTSPEYRTDFSGAIRQAIAENDVRTVSAGGSTSSYENYYHHRQSDQRSGKVSTPSILSPRLEQIATELVQSYSGKNSHMITDILQRPEGPYNSTSSTTTQQRQFEDLNSSQTIHDVDLLNTPQQLPPVDDYPPAAQCYGSGTAETYFHNQTKVYPTQLHGKMTFNNVQVYGSKWSAKGQPMVYNPDCSENPFPHQDQSYRQNYGSSESPSTYINKFPPLPDSNNNDASSTMKVPVCFDYRQFQLDSRVHKYQPSPSIYTRGQSGYQMDAAYPLSPDPLGLVGMVGSCPRPSHEVTQMTYTPKEMMESHLSRNSQSQRSKPVTHTASITDVAYSSIYPPKEYIDQTFNVKNNTSADDDSFTVRPPPLKKRYRPSKYDQLPFNAPMILPTDENIAPNPNPHSHETEPLNSRHKYVVVNPSSLQEMSPKSLIMKYIDFLIVENEQITDISQSPGDPEDIYVTDDMYFMQTLKRGGQFPSRKLRNWVKNFYPKLDLDMMEFNGQYPFKDPLSENPQNLAFDPRPTKQILNDTFYYCQRKLMSFQESC